METSISLKQYGILYFAGDVGGTTTATAFCYTDQDGKEHRDDRFAVGPSVHRHTVDFGRAKIDFDRGPCKYQAHLK